MRNPIGWLVILTSIGFGQNWEIEGVTTGGACAIAADSACLPQIAFGCPAGLGYARWTQDSWRIEYPQTGIVVPEVELCLDTNGLPHIAYKAGPHNPPYTDSIGYAYHDGDTWHIETVVRNATLLSLVLARDGTPHLAFQDSSGVRYARKAGDTWNILTVPAYQDDSLRWLIGASLALDTSDRPGIAVTWEKHGSYRDTLWLSFFEFDGTGWHRFDVDLAPGDAPWDFWRPSRVQYDPATDLFHIVYCYGRYATGRGSNWQVERAAGVSVGNWWYDFALHQGRPHIACSSAADLLTYQWRRAGGWEEELVADEVASAVSIAVDRIGRPHLAFVPFGEQTLYYARRLLVGTEEPAPTVVQPKLRLLVHPNPAPGAFTLEFPVRFPATAAIRLCDALGRTVWSQAEKVYPGQYCRRFCLSASISPGVYFLQVETDSQRSIEKVVLQ